MDTNNNLNNSTFYFDSTLLNEIEKTSLTNLDSLAELLNELNEKSPIESYPGFLYTSGYEDIYEVLNNSADYFFGSQKSEFTSQLDDIQKSSEDTIVKWFKALDVFTSKLKSLGGCVFTSISPSGGEDYVFLAFNNSNNINVIILLYHFYQAKNNASGWFDEFITDFDMSYEEFINKNPYDILIDTTILNYKFEDSPFGINCDSNFKYLGMNQTVFENALAGLKAAKKFC